MSMIGKSLAHYSITVEIGKGGMGEVYQAMDTKLGRKVAIKVLPEEFARDSDRIARFQREAKLLASLNHPNIAAIHGLEEADGTHFLVLELIEGQTLSERIKAGSIDVEEALKLALQIAEALEAAHEKGVIHRDLKPANIKVTPDGKVKVLDFGLAKAFAGEQADLNLSNSPTLSQAATMQGVILGTAAYMSPEQAKGKAVDRRADIWAFGVVLFEMLTGRCLFSGEDVSSTLARVLEREPDFSALPSNLHPKVIEMLERCLEKEAKNRRQNIIEVRFDLQKILADPDGVLVRPAAEFVQAAPRSKLPWIATGILAVALIGVIGAWIWFRPIPPVQRIPITLPATQTLPIAAGSLLAIHPDGQTLVYRALEGNTYKLYRRDLSQLNAKAISGTENALYSPFFSAEGQWLAFTAGTTLMKVSMAGGSPVRIAELPAAPRGGSWTPEGMIVTGMNNLGLMRVSAGGGNPEVIIAPKDGRQYWYPQVLPGGDAVMFTASMPQPDAGDLMLLDFEADKPQTLIQDAVAGRYIPTGHIVFLRGGDIWVVGFDLGKLKVVGDPRIIEQGIRVEAGGAVQMAVASGGSLIYIPAGETTAAERRLGLADRKGVVEYLSVPTKSYVAPRLSPDGRMLAVYTDGIDGRNIWIYELSGNTQIRQLTQTNTDIRPIWTPDGKRVTFGSEREGVQGIFWQPADGSSPAERLTTSESGQHWPESWSLDGRTLSFSAATPTGGRSIWTLSLDDGGQPELFYDPNATAYASEFSPDGNWLAYWSNESGSNEIWVQPFPAVPGVKHRITQNTGAMPLWSPDGTELFYRPSPPGQSILYSLNIRTNPTFDFTDESALPIGSFVTISNHRNWDITPDGERFVMIFPTGETNGVAPSPAQINIVLNFFEELK